MTGIILFFEKKGNNTVMPKKILHGTIHALNNDKTRRVKKELVVHKNNAKPTMENNRAIERKKAAARSKSCPTDMYYFKAHVQRLST